MVTPTPIQDVVVSASQFSKVPGLFKDMFPEEPDVYEAPPPELEEIYPEVIKKEQPPQPEYIPVSPDANLTISVAREDDPRGAEAGGHTVPIIVHWGCGKVPLTRALARGEIVTEAASEIGLLHTSEALLEGMVDHRENRADYYCNKNNPHLTVTVEPLNPGDFLPQTIHTTWDAKSPKQIFFANVDPKQFPPPRYEIYPPVQFPLVVEVKDAQLAKMSSMYEMSHPFYMGNILPRQIRDKGNYSYNGPFSSDSKGPIQVSETALNLGLYTFAHLDDDTKTYWMADPKKPTLRYGLPATPGTHKVRLYVFGYKPLVEEIAVRASDKQVTVTKSLSRISPKPTFDFWPVEPHAPRNATNAPKTFDYNTQGDLIDFVGGCKNFPFKLTPSCKAPSPAPTVGQVCPAGTMAITQAQTCFTPGTRADPRKDDAQYTDTSGRKWAVVGKSTGTKSRTVVCVPWTKFSDVERALFTPEVALQDQIFLLANAGFFDDTRSNVAKLGATYPMQENRGQIGEQPIRASGGKDYPVNDSTTKSCVATCGNGKVEPERGEECDAGKGNGTGGSSCTAACMLLSKAELLFGPSFTVPSLVTPSATACNVPPERLLKGEARCGKGITSCLKLVNKGDVEKSLAEGREEYVLRPFSYQDPGGVGRTVWMTLLDAHDGKQAKTGLYLLLGTSTKASGSAEAPSGDEGGAAVDKNSVLAEGGLLFEAARIRGGTGSASVARAQGVVEAARGFFTRLQGFLAKLFSRNMAALGSLDESAKEKLCPTCNFAPLEQSIDRMVDAEEMILLAENAYDALLQKKYLDTLDTVFEEAQKLSPLCREVLVTSMPTWLPKWQGSWANMDFKELAQEMRRTERDILAADAVIRSAEVVLRYATRVVEDLEAAKYIKEKHPEYLRTLAYKLAEAHEKKRRTAEGTTIEQLMASHKTESVDCICRWHLPGGGDQKQGETIQVANPEECTQHEKVIAAEMSDVQCTYTPNDEWLKEYDQTTDVAEQYFEAYQQQFLTTSRYVAKIAEAKQYEQSVRLIVSALRKAQATNPVGIEEFVLGNDEQFMDRQGFPYTPEIKAALARPQMGIVRHAYATALEGNERSVIEDEARLLFSIAQDADMESWSEYLVRKGHDARGDVSYVKTLDFGAGPLASTLYQLIMAEYPGTVAARDANAVVSEKNKEASIAFGLVVLVSINPLIGLTTELLAGSLMAGVYSVAPDALAAAGGLAGFDIGGFVEENFGAGGAFAYEFLAEPLLVQPLLTGTLKAIVKKVNNRVVARRLAAVDTLILGEKAAGVAARDQLAKGAALTPAKAAERIEERARAGALGLPLRKKPTIVADYIQSRVRFIKKTAAGIFSLPTHLIAHAKFLNDAREELFQNLASTVTAAAKSARSAAGKDIETVVAGSGSTFRMRFESAVNDVDVTLLAISKKTSPESGLSDIWSFLGDFRKKYEQEGLIPGAIIMRNFDEKFAKSGYKETLQMNSLSFEEFSKKIRAGGDDGIEFAFYKFVPGKGPVPVNVHIDIGHRQETGVITSFSGKQGMKRPYMGGIGQDIVISLDGAEEQMRLLKLTRQVGEDIYKTNPFSNTSLDKQVAMLLNQAKEELQHENYDKAIKRLQSLGLLKRDDDLIGATSAFLLHSNNKLMGYSKQIQSVIDLQELGRMPAKELLSFRAKLMRDLTALEGFAGDASGTAADAVATARKMGALAPKSVREKAASLLIHEVVDTLSTVPDPDWQKVSLSLREAYNWRVAEAVRVTLNSIQ